MNNRILILGSGYIGKKLQSSLKCSISNDRINNFDDAQRLINKFKPKILINCIGYTGRNVDDCELNKNKTLFANTFIPIILAEIAIRNKIKLIHISSGCIYNFDYLKSKPIKEEQVPDFFNLFYSRSKIYSERALEVLCKSFDILILRIRIPLDNQAHPKNLLDKLIKYKKVINLKNSVTYIPNFVNALKHLIKIKAKGIYNLVNKGGLDYTKLMNIYKKYNPEYKFKVIDFDKLHLVRTNLILSTEKLGKSGFKIRKIEDVLEECVKDYVKY